MIAEEIELLVEANVEKALKEFQKLLPAIKKQLSGIQKEFEKVNIKDIKASIDTSQVVKKVQQAKKQIKEAFDPNVADFSTNIKDKITGVSKEFSKMSGKKIDLGNAIDIKLYNEKLKETANYASKAKEAVSSIGTVKYDTNSIEKYISEYNQIKGRKSFKDKVNMLGKNKDFQNFTTKMRETAPKQDYQVNLKWRGDTLTTLNFEPLVEQIKTAKQYMSEFIQNINQAGTSQNRLTSFFSAFKGKIEQAKTTIGNMKNSFKQLPNITQSITNNVKKMGTGIKSGLGHVLKYASALLSLRGIYNILSNSAQSWLSSQNAGAQQLSANIEYMKYAMGSAFAPVIEYVINLVYQLMKALQSVVYAFSGINIFAKATASSMGKTAKSAKETNKSLAGVHNEINNVSENDTGSGGGSVSPNMDLSRIENTPNTILEAIKNGNWYEVGSTIGQKLNEAMENIPWDKIQDTARKIGRGTAELLNGFIATTDWKQVGNTFAQGVNTVIYTGYEFVTTFDWKQFGKAIGDTISGFFKNIDWATAGKTLGETIKGVFDSISGFFETFDWSTIIDGLIDFLKNIDWSGIARSMFRALGSACASFVKLGVVIGGYIREAFNGIGQYFQDKIEECGGNVVLGILKGIGDAVLGIGQWIYENIFQPFIEGFKNAFGIHSPSTVMAEMGKYIIDGLFNGLSNVWERVSSIFVNLVSKIGDKFTEIKTNIGTWAENTKETIRGWVDNAKTKISECWTNISTTVGEKIDTVKTNISLGLDNAKSTISTWANNIKTTWGEHWSNMASEVGNGLNTAKSNIDTWTSGVTSALSGLGTNATTWGRDLAVNMATGIKSNINTVANAAKAVANNISSYLHFSEPDVGPLSNFHTYMPDMIDLMTQGIHNNMGKLTNELETMTEMMSYKINTPNIAPLSLEAKNNNPIQPRNVMADTLSSIMSDGKGDINITIPLTMNVGNKKIAEILLENLRDMKRQTGKDIEALVG